MSSEMLDLFVQSFGETLLMVGVAGALGALVGLPLGIMLYLTDRGGILPAFVSSVVRAARGS